MTVQYAFLLDSGMAIQVTESSRDAALARVRRWQAARLTALAERSLVVPRRVVALIRIHPKPLKQRMAMLASRHRRKPRGGKA